MNSVLSNTDALLVAIPMVGLLFAGFFRLDEMIGKPKAHTGSLRQKSGWDKNGKVICIDPDGHIERAARTAR